MRKEFIINIVLIVAVNLAIKPLWIFGIDRNMQLSLGDEQYGLYAALMNLSIVLNILLDMGITNLNNKLVAEDSSTLQKNILNISIAKLILFFVYLLAMLICAVLFQYNATATKLLLYIAFIQFLNSFLTFLRSNISGNQLFKTDSLLSVADKLIMVIIVGIILLTPELKKNFTIFQFVYCQIASYIIVIVVAILFTKKMIGQKLHFSLKLFLPIIQQTLPYAILILLMGIYMRSDMFLMERWLPNGSLQSGLYAKNFRLLDAFNMIGFLFAGMLLPMFARLYAEGKSILPLLQISNKLLIPASAAISIFCGFYASEILTLLYHQTNANAILSFRLVIAVFPAMCIMNIYSTLLTSVGKINTLIKITFCGALASILLNYFAIVYFKNYIGTCWVALLVQYAVNIGYLVGCSYVFGKKIWDSFGVQFWGIVALYILVNVVLCFFKTPLISAAFCNAIIYILVLIRLGFNKSALIKQYFVSK